MEVGCRESARGNENGRVSEDDSGVAKKWGEVGLVNVTRLLCTVGM